MFFTIKTDFPFYIYGHGTKNRSIGGQYKRDVYYYAMYIRILQEQQPTQHVEQ